jgi:O-antigen/teichoic acid export membrane protein
MNWRSLIPQGKFAKNVGILAGGTAISQALLILSTPILTRIFSPEEFGVYSVYLSILAMLVVVGSLLYEMAIPLPKSNEVAINIVALCIILIIIFGFIHMVVFILFAPTIAALLNTPSIENYLWMIPIAFIGGAVFHVVHFWCIRKEQFKFISITKLSQSSVQIISQISLGLFKLGQLGLLIGDVIGRLIAGLTITILSFKKEKEVLSNISWQSIKQNAKRYREFPLLSSGSVVLNSVSLQIPVILLTASYGPYVVGLYVLAQRILGLPISIIGSAVAEVYLSEASKIKKSNPRAIRKLFWKTTTSISLLSVIFITIIALVAPHIFSFVFGEQWKEAGVYVQLLAIMYFFQFISAPIGSNIPVFERQDLHLIREVLRLILLIVTFWYVNWANVSATFAIILLSLAGSIGYLIHSLFSWYAMEKHFSLLGKEHKNED